MGESGSGKTTLGKAILGANKISAGQVIFHDDNTDYDLANINKKELTVLRILFTKPDLKSLLKEATNP